MRTIASNIIVPNEPDIEGRGRQIESLVKQYLPGFVTVDYGYKNIGRSQIAYPALFIDPMKVDYQMHSVGKTLLTITYFLQWFVTDNRSDDVLTLCESGMKSLMKLFSNNALEDISTTHTAKFKANPGYWVDSNMSGTDISRALKNASPQNINTYVRVGQMKLTVIDEVIA